MGGRGWVKRFKYSLPVQGTAAVGLGSLIDSSLRTVRFWGDFILGASREASLNKSVL